MTLTELRELLPGDSIIGLDDSGDELPVVHVESMQTASRVVHVRSGAGSVPYLVFALGEEIVGQSRLRRVE